MKNRLLLLTGKIMLRKWALIESVGDQLKDISQIGHTGHRSMANCFVSLLARPAAYTWRGKKSSSNIRGEEQFQLVFQLTYVELMLGNTASRPMNPTPATAPLLERIPSLTPSNRSQTTQARSANSVGCTTVLFSLHPKSPRP
jgi:hypothetical protein